MAHEIEQNDKVVTGSKLPWHRLGHNTGQAMTMAEAIELAELDWQVTKVPLQATIHADLPTPTGASVAVPVQQIEVPGRFATMRVDTQDVLGVVGSGYTPFQNTELADTAVGVLVDSGEVKVQTAGSLRGNRTVWFLLELADKQIELAGGIVVPYLLAMTSHDGTMAIRMAATPVYVVCQNTLTWAVDGTPASWTTKHTANVTSRIGEAQEALGLARTYFDAWEAEAHQLLDTAVSEQEFDAIVRAAFPMPEGDDVSARTLDRVADRRDEVFALAASAPEATGAAGTGWAAMQALSTWDLWHRPVRGQRTAADAGLLRAERQANRIMAGTPGAWLGKVKHLVDIRADLVKADDDALAKLTGGVM